MEDLRWGRPDGVLVSREAVVAEARTWKGTPFMHQQHIKGIGCDCGGLTRGVSVELGLIPPDYATQIPKHLHGYGRHPDGNKARELCDRYWIPIDRKDMQAGDVVIVKFDSDPQHTAILVPYRYGGFAIVHAAMRGVIETRLLFGHEPKSMKYVSAYRLPGVG